MSLILSLETSTALCSVAIHRDGLLLSSHETMAEGGHAKQLTRLIEAATQEIAIHLTAVDAIAVSIGPGSYTGLRIGLATAKGLCFGMDKPLIAIQTLAIMAHAWKDQKGFLLPMMDARRMEVYAAIFDAETYEEKQASAPVILTAESFDSFESGPILAFGNGALKWQSTCKHPAIHFSEVHPYPEARYMGELAQQAFLNNDFANLVTDEPAYLKEFMGTKPTSKAL